MFYPALLLHVVQDNNNCQVPLQDMERQGMINKLLGSLQLSYAAYRTSCYPYECTYTEQKTMYVLVVEFLGALGGLIQLALGLGTLILWPVVMFCCRWESGDRAWDPTHEDTVPLSTVHPQPKGAYTGPF